MIRTRFKKVLLVAPEVFPNRLLTDYENVKHISALSAIFPAIFELNPHVIVFDYDYMGKDMEKILRRISINKFYDKIKICCYKSEPNEKIDDFLKVLGVDQMVYLEDLARLKKNKPAVNSLNTIFDASIMKLMASVSN
jgi:hypothetical protein